MKNPKNMTYKELEDEVRENHRELKTADRERSRELIRRDHLLITEMDSRWNNAGYTAVWGK